MVVLSSWKMASGASADSDECGICEKNVREKDSAVQCEYSEKWMHTKCEDISQEKYLMMQEDGGGIKWFCTIEVQRFSD